MSRLERAYRVTTYAAGPLRLRIGEPNAALDELLARHGAATWAYLTAWNPGSVPRGETENRAAARRLLDRLAGYPCIEGESVGDGGAWREPSVLVLGIRRDEALAIARDFGQLAFVVGERGGAPRLVWSHANP
ncbi:MAG: hypothetical protein QOE90_2112 [Thermoplasmata archaeon]|jgi:hypothetical protein|nr:hypothetical protein [Thermoplasmata archaeon]